MSLPHLSQVSPRIVPQIVISGNGASTQTKRLQTQSTSRDLVASSSLNGTNASPALNGENGKPVQLELYPNPKGGIYVIGLIGKTSSATHVEPNLDLLVTSRGSDGEDGGKGEDGKPGKRGTNGEDATKHSDAKLGGDGGPGGDGGLGSSGGNGGNGGTVYIITTEENMHLILVAGWDVGGGKGGKVGEHGLPGRGGFGGHGGSGYKWKEYTGYEWKCVAHDGRRSVSAPLTGGNLATLGQLQAGQDLQFSFPQGYVSDGRNVAQVGNIQGRIPAAIAPQFQRALLGSGSDTLSDASIWAGQLSTSVRHAPGCKQKPVYTTRRRPAASNGRQGPSGRAPTAALEPGRDGLDGTAAILVRNGDGSISRYDSRFEFQLLDFEVLDENDDGIFEPGECVIIKNFRIKNTGGMPTPKKTLIPLRMQPSSWLTPVPGKDVVYLPFDIPPGGMKTINNEIWARISPPRDPPNSTAFTAVSAIKLQSVVPDIDRKLPYFEYSESITLQYPVKLVSDEVRWMDTIPQGSLTSLKWVVMNISSKDLGCNSKSQRNIVTKISCPPTAPGILGDTLSTSPKSGRNCSMHGIDFLQRDMSSPVSESLRIPEDAPEYSLVDFLIELFLTPASVDRSRKSPDLIMLQTYKLSMQVSKKWKYNSSSEFLLLTSKSTTQNTVNSWSRFIQEHLHMSVDVWNVSLYGGLQDEATRKSVLDRYVGRTVLALDDDLFQYFDQGQRSILDFIDPLEGSDLSRKGTRVVSVQRKAEARNQREEKNVEHIAQAAALKGPHLTADELHHLKNTDELIARLHKIRENPLSSASSASNEQYFIPFNGSNQASKGKRIARRLLKEFPLDQFMVTDSADNLGMIIVHLGSHGQGYSTAQVAQTSNGVDRVKEFSGLNPGEAYSCVAALPLKARLDILLESQQGVRTLPYSEFIQNTALSSVKAELHDQVQAMAKHPRWRDGIFSNPDNISTTPLFDLANDKITAVLQHDLIRDAGISLDDLSSPAGQILRSIIQSARCQTTEQLLMKYFVPFKRTRSHIKQNLMGNVERIIASADPTTRNPKERIKTFRRSVSQHLLRKNYQADINNHVQTITHDAIRDIKQSLTTIEGVMPTSVYKSSAELLTRRKSYAEAEMQRRRDRTQHHQWKEELGMDMTKSGFTENHEAAELEEDVTTASLELTPLSTYNKSMLSNSSLSEASTVLTLPEMNGSSPSKIENLYGLPVGICELESLPPTPQSILNASDGLPELSKNLHIEKENEPWFECDEIAPRTPTSPKDLYNWEVIGDDMGGEIDRNTSRIPTSPVIVQDPHLIDNSLGAEPLVWSEYNEESPTPPRIIISNSQVTNDDLGDKTSVLPEDDEKRPTAPPAIRSSQATDDKIGHELDGNTAFRNVNSNDDPGEDTLVWSEYDEDELRIDW